MKIAVDVRRSVTNDAVAANVAAVAIGGKSSTTVRCGVKKPAVVTAKRKMLRACAIRFSKRQSGFLGNCSEVVQNRPKKLPAVAGNTANKSILIVARTVPAGIVDRAVAPAIVLREIAANSRNLTENPFIVMSEYKNRAIGGNFCGCK